MRFKDLPFSEILGTAASIVELTLLLERAVERKLFFVSSEAIGYLPFCGRILTTTSVAPRPNASTAQPRISVEIGRELLEIIPHIGYPVTYQHQLKWKKGWQVRKAIRKKEIFVIVFPAWVRPPSEPGSEFQFELKPQ